MHSGKLYEIVHEFVQESVWGEKEDSRRSPPYFREHCRLGTITDDAMDVTMGTADKGDERSFLLFIGGW